MGQEAALTPAAMPEVAGASAHPKTPTLRPCDRCANCGAVVAGAYCSACGQKLHLHRSLAGALHEMVHGLLHFDSKVWRTLPLLAFRPGFLTRDYIAGRRACYTAPLRSSSLRSF